MSDRPVEDAKSAMIGGPRGSVCPTAEEVIFLIEAVYFVHEIFCDIVIEGGLWWFAEWWELCPT